MTEAGRDVRGVYCVNVCRECTGCTECFEPAQEEERGAQGLGRTGG